MSQRNKRRKVFEEDRASTIKMFRMGLVKILDKFHHSLQYHLGHNYPDDYLTLSTEEKVKHLLSVEKGLGTEPIKAISNTLRREGAKNLRNLHSKYVSQEKMNKNRMCQNLARHFYGETFDQEKRSEEKKNLGSIDLNRDYRFQKICQIVIPVEIVLKIFSFIRFNNDSETFFSVSSVSKIFYVTALRSFDEIQVTKSSVYQISVLALRNTKKVNIMCFFIKDKFSAKELNYVFDELSQNIKLKVICLGMNISLHQSFFNALRRFLKKNPSKTRITNIERLRFKIDMFRKYEHRNACDEQKHDNPKKTFKLCDIFKNLRIVESPLSLITLKGLKSVESLVLGVDYRPYFSKNGIVNTNHTIEDENLNKVFSIERLRHINTENLKSLTLKMAILKSQTYDFLFNDPQFSKLEEIIFTPCYVGNSTENPQDYLFNFSNFLRSSCSLRRLVIRIPDDCDVLIQKSGNNNNNNIFQLPMIHSSIEDFEVYFIVPFKKSISYPIETFDTTFSAITTKGWERLKSFRGALSTGAGTTTTTTLSSLIYGNFLDCNYWMKC